MTTLPAGAKPTTSLSADDSTHVAFRTRGDYIATLSAAGSVGWDENKRHQYVLRHNEAPGARLILWPDQDAVFDRWFALVRTKNGLLGTDCCEVYELNG